MAKPAPVVVRRHSRALRILSCLQAGPSFNASDLALRLQVSRRTIYRDLDLIRAAGIDIVFDEERDAYRVQTHRDLAPAKLEPEDLTKLMVTSQLSPFTALSPDFSVSVRESMCRLLAPYPEHVREPIQRILNACSVKQSGTKRQSDVLQRVMVAIGRGVQLDLMIERERTDEPEAAESPGLDLEQVRFAPYQIQMDGEWLLIGRTPTERNRRVVPLRLIRNAELTNSPYKIPRRNRAV